MCRYVHGHFHLCRPSFLLFVAPLARPPSSYHFPSLVFWLCSHLWILGYSGMSVFPPFPRPSLFFFLMTGAWLTAPYPTCPFHTFRSVLRLRPSRKTHCAFVFLSIPRFYDTLAYVSISHFFPPLRRLSRMWGITFEFERYSVLGQYTSVP